MVQVLGIMAKNGGILKLSVRIKSMPPRLSSLYQPFPIGGHLKQVCHVLWWETPDVDNSKT